MRERISAALNEAKSALEHLLSDSRQIENIERSAVILIESLHAGGRVISCGNGGSMCDAMHLAEELSGRFRQDRPAMAALAISDPSYLTCVANDYGYNQVFARYIEGNGRSEDVLFAISTSGTSPSVVLAAVAARSKGMKVVALTGKPGSELELHADTCICTPGGKYADRTQELHINVIHILIELIEHELHPASKQQ